MSIKSTIEDPAFVRERKSCPKLRLCGRSYLGYAQRQSFHLTTQWPWCYQVVSAFKFLCCQWEKTYASQDQAFGLRYLHAHAVSTCAMGWMLMLVPKDWHCRCPGNTRDRGWRSFCFAYRVGKALKRLWYFPLWYHANNYGFLFLSAFNIF